jgi:hypothetical protein
MIFDKPFLIVALEDVGFCSIRPWDWQIIDHIDFNDLSQAHLPHMKKYKSTLVSLNLEALKQ